MTTNHSTLKQASYIIFLMLIKGFCIIILFFSISCSTGGDFAPVPVEPLTEPTPTIGVSRDKQLREQKNSESSKITQDRTTKKQIEITTDLSSWELISEEEKIKTYRSKVEQGTVLAFRGETVIAAPILNVLTVFIDDQNRKEWVDSFVEAKLLRQYSKFDRIEYNHIAAQWPFQNRDFVYRVKVGALVNPKTVTIELQSTTDPLMPPREGIVRGEIIYSYYWIQETSQGASTRVVVEMAVDPMGNIPKWLANMSQKNWPSNTLKGLTRLSARDGIQVNPEVEKYFNFKDNAKGDE